MKLKKNAKIFIIVLVVVVVLILGGIIVSKLIPKKEEVKEAKVIDTIDDYGYVLKDNKSKEYQALFKELITVLNEKEIDEAAYANKLSEMFIVDFYSLSDKSAKTDVGGVDFVYKDVLENFLINAQDTFYKYVESNIYNNRNQQLPEVDTITINAITKETFAYGTKNDDNAYIINVSWTYTSEDFSSYQNNAKLVFIHDENKLCLVELK